MYLIFDKKNKKKQVHNRKKTIINKHPFQWIFLCCSKKQKCLLYIRTINTSPAFVRLSGIRAGWGIEINGRFEAERPPASAGPPSEGRTAT